MLENIDGNRFIMVSNDGMLSGSFFGAGDITLTIPIRQNFQAIDLNLIHRQWRLSMLVIQFCRVRQDDQR